MKSTLRAALQQTLQQLGLDSRQLPDFMVEVPRDPSHGDLASNVALVSSKALGRPPRELADAIRGELLKQAGFLSHVAVAGPGFLNVRFHDAFLQGLLKQVRDAGSEYGKTRTREGERVLVEFVSANPTGPLTVGHGRNAVLGDTLSRLLEWTGASVDREYYFNNAGRQMRVLGESVRARYQQLCGQPSELPEGGYEGEYIQEIARTLQEEHDDSLLASPGSPAFKERAEKVIFEDILGTLRRMGIHMDSFFNEHTLYENQAIDKAVKKLRELGLAYDADGAVWFRTSELGKEKDTVLVKSSGEPTYRLPDIAYHLDKLDRGYDLCLDVFGADHIDTYPDVVRGVEALGGDASKIDVVVYQFVTLVKDGKPFKMSTRKANFVTLDELMDEVGSDVTRFFFLMRAPNTHLEFDLDQARETSEKNPVFYLQYAHARIQSILRKVDEVAKQAGGTASHHAGEPDLTALTHTSELTLVRGILGFPDAIESAASTREPQKLIHYLQQLASDFTGFYHDCRILGEPDEVRTARAALAQTTAQVLKNGLAILGISAPDRM
jgi:arginyl-tRNA synthetase